MKRGIITGIFLYVRNMGGTSLAVQWLRLRTSAAGGAGSIPGRGTKIPHATQHGQKKRKKERSVMCKEFNSAGA